MESDGNNNAGITLVLFAEDFEAKKFLEKPRCSLDENLPLS